METKGKMVRNNVTGAGFISEGSTGISAVEDQQNSSDMEHQSDASLDYTDYLEI